MVMMGWLLSGFEFQVGLEIESDVVWVGYDCWSSRLLAVGLSGVGEMRYLEQTFSRPLAGLNDLSLHNPSHCNTIKPSWVALSFIKGLIAQQNTGRNIRPDIPPLPWAVPSCGDSLLLYSSFAFSMRLVWCWYSRWMWLCFAWVDRLDWCHTP